MGALSTTVQVISSRLQGSAFGPHLCLVYTADLKCSISSHFALYTDDVKIYNDIVTTNLLRKMTSQLFMICCKNEVYD